MSNNNNLSLDSDPIETKEWLDALHSVTLTEGATRAQFLLSKLLEQMGQPGVGLNAPYINTVPLAKQVVLPAAELDLYKRLEAIIRWNAVMIVLSTAKKEPDLGGHLATFASSATLYEIGFNYFFRGRTDSFGGDLIYFQGHAITGTYARAYLRGLLTKEQISHFRQEVDGIGISSYPHPWLMPDFWQFPTVSMGLGPLQAIYQAQMMRYLHNRGLADTAERKVWAFLGDGEIDEPESTGAITLASRDKLNNLIFVVNCNLQRLDGPVRGNGKIIRELESLFTGAGWNVIKILWGSRWDELLADDVTGILKQRMWECLDGEYQNYASHDGAFFREHFFGKYPELKAMVAEWSDAQLAELALDDGGHDPEKVFAAYAAAMQEKNRPTLILAKTIKGYGLPNMQGMNIAHQQKKVDDEDLQHFRDFFKIPASDADIDHHNFLKPAENSAEMQYMREKREKLGSDLPRRVVNKQRLTIPPLSQFKAQLEATGEREISTTMAFVRILNVLLKDSNIGKIIAPIVPDESRTFGMEGLFRQIGIFSPLGQLYDPVDRAQVMYYREAKDGQYIEHGITESGSMASWMAAASAYSAHNSFLIPFYLFYSMHGLQRMGDLAWAAGDLRCRGFLLGATAGRTTLAGEGLQHNDGHSHIIASIIPNCVSYDPTFSYELAVIVQNGLQRMYVNQEDIYYYITIMNENYVHPGMPKDAEEGIIKGMYLFKRTLPEAKVRLQLLGSGTILREVIKAAEQLAAEYQIGADIWSVTSFTELRRDGISVDRYNILHPSEKSKTAYATECLKQFAGPVVAATDYMRAYAEQIRSYVPHPYYVLGTDGFGRSDTRNKLRQFFEVNACNIVYTALKALVDNKQLPENVLATAQQKHQINPAKPDPWKV